MIQKTNKTKALIIAAWIAGAALLVWYGVSFAETVRRCTVMDKNPQGFVDSMVYMSIKGKDMLVTGVWTTVRIALLGTAIAFVLAILLVFLRIQEPDRRDSGVMKALKWLASHFARFYVFVIRGTPMMVQALIFYYFGFNLFKKTGMTVTEINQGPDRGGAQRRHDELADDDEGGFPPGGEEFHPRHRQRVHHQHQGFVGSVGHRRDGPHVRDKVRERHLFPLAGDLLRGGAFISGADLAVVAAFEVAGKEAGHAGARHPKLELKEAAV